METQQLLEILARMEAKMNASQAEMKANKEDMLAEMSGSVKSNQDLLPRLEARIKTSREKDREDLKEMQEEI
jgi:hypothetical protein